MTVGSLPFLAGAAGLVIIGRRANRRKQERRKGDSR
jgi:hypothetical protein